MIEQSIHSRRLSYDRKIAIQHDYVLKKQGNSGKVNSSFIYNTSLYIPIYSEAI